MTLCFVLRCDGLYLPCNLSMSSIRMVVGHGFRSPVLHQNVTMVVVGPCVPIRYVIICQIAQMFAMPSSSPIWFGCMPISVTYPFFVCCGV